MEVSDEIKEAKEILQNIIKAKKTIRMYPENNPIYIKTLEDSYTKFKDIFDFKENFTLIIKQHSIHYDTEQIYYSHDKEDNLALFFFKDGLREITFTKGLLPEELEEFLKIIARDFERETVDDDVVTLLWEKDFKNILYVVDEAFLVDDEQEDYQNVAERKVKEKVTEVDDLMKAYIGGFAEEDVNTISVVPLSDKDLQILVKELEKDATEEKVEKLVAILFELIYQSEDKPNLEDVFSFLKDAVTFSMKNGNITAVLNIMKKTREVVEGSLLTDEGKKYMRMLPSYLGNDEIIGLLAEILDSGLEIDSRVFEEFIAFIEKNAIEPLIKQLGELTTIKARKNVIEALAVVGKKDIQTLSRGLDDQRWYVVRNIIYILRKIGDRRATEYLMRTVRHGDVRVRKEVVKALGELGGREVVQILRECLDDPDMQVRIASAKAFSNMGSEAAKKIIIDKISDKIFKEKTFEEKKDFFEALSRWKDKDVFDFLIKMLKATAFFGRSKNYENRACAAFCLGLICNKDAIPLLDKCKDSGNKLLRDFSYAAVKKIEHGQ